MSQLLRSLVVRVGLDSKDTQAKLKNLGKDLKTAGRDMTNTGMSLTKGLTVPILGAAVAAVKYASDMEESTNKVNVAFKDSAGQVKDFSTTTLKSFGIAKGTALDMASTFGDMGTAMGQLPSVAADMSTSLVGLAGDMASFKNISLEQASTALRGIYTGEGEALKTLGVVMQDSTLIAYAQANGYEKLYKEMTQSEKVALRYKYVMEATKNAQGDFARTSDGVANQTRMVQESLKEAAASIGQFLLPMVAKGAQGVNGLIEKFTSLDDSTKKNIIGIGAVAAGIGPAVTVMGHLTTGAGKLMTNISAASKAISGGAGLVPSLGKMIGPGGVATLVVLATAAYIAILAKQTEETRKATAEVNKFVKSVETSAEAYADQTNSIKDNASVAMNLTAKLENLSNKTNRTNAEQNEMVRIVSQLNTLVPDLNLSIDEQTGLLNKQVGEIRDLIDVKREQLTEQANEERYVELLKQQAEGVDKIRAAETRLGLARNIFKNLDKSVFATAAEFKAAKADLLALEVAQDSVGKSLTLLDAEFEQSAKNMVRVREDGIWVLKEQVEEEIELIETVAETRVETAEETKTREEAALKEADRVRRSYYKAEQDMLDEFQVRVKENRDRMQGEYKDYLDTRENMTEKHMNEMGGLDQKGIEQTELTAREIKRNLKRQIKDFQEWRAEIQQLSSRVPGDVMRELQALGPSFAPVIEELNGMTDKQLNSWIDVWQMKSGEAVDAATEELSYMPGAMYTVGENGALELTKGLINGLPALKTSITKHAEDLGGGYIVAFAKGMDNFTAYIKAAAKRANNAAELGPFEFRNATTGKIGMSAYAEGTNYVPQTGPAILHQGEAVLTAQENASLGDRIASAVSSAGGGDVVVNVYVEDILTATQKVSKRKNARTGRVTIPLGV